MEKCNLEELTAFPEQVYQASVTPYLCGLLGAGLIQISAQDGPDVPDLAVRRNLLCFCALRVYATAAGGAVWHEQRRPIRVLLQVNNTSSVTCFDTTSRRCSGANRFNCMSIGCAWCKAEGWSEARGSSPAVHSSSL